MVYKALRPQLELSSRWGFSFLGVDRALGLSIAVLIDPGTTPMLLDSPEYSRYRLLPP